MFHNIFVPVNPEFSVKVMFVTRKWKRQYINTLTHTVIHTKFYQK